MEYEQIRYEVDGHTLTLTLDRPERMNAFTTRMQEELCDALDRADTNDTVRSVVVTGAGRGFCAGADLASGGNALDAGPPPADGSVPRDSGGLVALRIFESAKPIIGAINGPAVGIGATMTLPMDVRLASTSARIGFVFTRRGIVPEAASSWFLPRVVGISRALEWVTTGRVFDADEALAAGLVRAVHEPDDLLPAAYALADEIAANAAPVAVALSRRMLWSMMGEDHPMAAHRADSRALLSLGRSADVREGITAFLEKRPAAFPDRVSAGLPDVMPWREEPRFS